ncbi:hypothetical protein [Actinoplanes sp. CA-252034]|uniref:hypothetical protein n=1 Tax=Actinoplanes sp. CA-252034 TaxID=3239906 RepID=UPI003D960002
MAELPEYDASHIEVLEFDESVRRRPGMYFYVARDDPRLVDGVLGVVLFDAIHPESRWEGSHSPVTAEITGDFAFSVANDRAEALATSEGEAPADLLHRMNWQTRAAAAMSIRTVVEVWHDQTGLRQEFAGTHPSAPPAAFSPPAGSGTRISCVLDPSLFAPNAAISADGADVDAHGPYCLIPHGPMEIRDLRRRTA